MRHNHRMQLRRVVAKNYRAFRSAELRLPANGLVLVAGANNTGKSALMSALDLVAGIDSGEAVRHAGSSDAAKLSATFSLDPEERMLILQNAVRQSELIANGALQTVELIFEERQGAPPRLVEVWGQLPSLGMSKLFSATLSPETGDGKLEAIVDLLPGQSPDEAFTLSTRHTNRVSVWLDEHMESLPDLEPLMKRYQAWRERFYHFRALRPGSQPRMNLASERVLRPTGDNLPAVLLDLQTNRPQLFADLRRLIAEIVPEVGLLETPTAGNAMEVTFADPYSGPDPF